MKSRLPTFCALYDVALGLAEAPCGGGGGLDSNRSPPLLSVQE